MERRRRFLYLAHLRLLLPLVLPLLFSSILECSAESSVLIHRPGIASRKSLCAELIRPKGYACFEHTVETEDGYILGVQHIPRRKRYLKVEPSLPVFLQHGLFQIFIIGHDSTSRGRVRIGTMAGDTWFINPIGESLGYILADQGFDVWVGNVRGTRWSHGHITLSETEKAFWDWSWEDLAQYDLGSMIRYVYSITNSSILFIGHSQGTIMGLAAFTMPDIVEMIEAAALLSPISYLNHITSHFILKAVDMHIDKILLAAGIHELNFRRHAFFSQTSTRIIESLCDDGLNCTSLLFSVTGENCCFNRSRIDYYLQYEPHPSSTKNLNHLFQMIRKGSFSKYDYGLWGNLVRYGNLHPPAFNLADIPRSLALWLAFGGKDALADITDVRRTIRELRSRPKLLYLDSYGHLDFIMSVNAKSDVYLPLIRFLGLQGRHRSHSNS